MKSIIKVSIAFCYLISATMQSYAQETANDLDLKAIEKAKSGWWTQSMENQEERIAWWEEARFGMFVHWGVYSVPGGIWKDASLGRAYAEHLMRIKKIPLSEYKEKLVSPFNPTEFNADEWVKTAKDAGMKYFVITAKHHDGFALYDSDVSSYNIVDATEFKRDPMIELKEACKKYGLKFGFYYSHAFDWEHPDAPGNDWDYENPGGDRNLFGGRGYYKEHPELIARMAKYVDSKSIPQIRELLIKYEPDIIWFDTPHKLSFSENLRILEEIRKISPNVVVNGRLARGFGDYINTADRPYEFFPIEAKNWEAIPTTNESYGYSQVDGSHKPASFFIQLLAKSASRGGNLLMNIGPKGNGKIDKKDFDILKGIGNWLTINGESIYGTDKTTLPLQSWGVSTRNNNNLYLHIFNWPKNNKLIVGGLKSKFGEAYFLNDQNKSLLKMERINNEDVEITLPENAFDSINAVVVFKIKEPIISAETRLLSTIDENKLLAFDAKLHGEGFKYGDGKQSRYYCYNWITKEQYISWDIRVNENVMYDVFIKYQSSQDSKGTYTLSVNNQKLTNSVAISHKKKENKIVNLGQINLAQGKHTLKIQPEEITGDELMKIFEIVLIPSK